MSDITYEASVYSRSISYRNFKGEEATRTLYFALDPIQLMRVISSIKPKKIKSGNPAKNGQDMEITDEDQLKFIVDLASKAAGFPSDDGEIWIPFNGFADSIVGKAFITKLASSDGDRKEFSEKVVLDPFRAFVEYAASDNTNSPSDIQQFKTMLKQIENVFTVDNREETIEERRARLEAEMAALGDS